MWLPCKHSFSEERINELVSKYEFFRVIDGKFEYDYKDMVRICRFMKYEKYDFVVHCYNKWIIGDAVILDWAYCSIKNKGEQK